MNSKLTSKTSFLNTTIKLTLNSLISQLVPLLFYPIFTRVFLPEDFGLAATFLTIIPIVTIISTGTFEFAILNSNSEKESIYIISYILGRSIFILSIIQVLILFGGNNFFSRINLKDISTFAHLIPLTVFLSVITIVFNEWLILQNNFKKLGAIKIINSVSVSSAKYFISFFKALSNGLILGEFLGRLITAIVSFIHIQKYNISIKKLMNGLKHYKLVVDRFKDLGRWTMSEQLISNIGGALPNLLIGFFFTSKELGYFALSGSLLTAPITVVTISIRDVFRNKVSENFKLEGNSKILFVKLLKKITLIGIISFSILYFLLPYLIQFGLGSNWSLVAEYSKIQLPMFLLSFISMSLSGVLIIANKLKHSFFWQIYYTIITFASLIIGFYIFKTIEKTLLCLVIGRCSAYLIYMKLSFDASKG